MKKKWTATDIPDQTGKNAIVTGANSGLGYHTSLELAKKGAHVIMACRNKKKGNLAASRILNQVPSALLDVMSLDLASFSSIRFFAGNFSKKYNQLDILVNNAGVMALPKMKTADGFEMQFGTNHLGHFALTALLFPILKKTVNSRVVTLSSLMHKMGKILFADLNRENSYAKWKAYGQSKLANLMFATEFQKKLDAHKIKMLSLAAHPGWSSTNLQTKGAELEHARFKKKMNEFANKLLAQSASMGALPGLFASTSPDVKPGAYYGPGGWFKMHGYPVEENINRKLVDPEISRKLWLKSEELTGIKFNFNQKLF